jgi:CheY-like chemotaxis protein
MSMDTVVPTKARCTPSEGAPFSAAVRGFDETGLFLQSGDRRLGYMEIIRIQFEGTGIEAEAQIVALVPKRGVRLELVPDTSRQVRDAFAVWATAPKKQLEGLRVLVVDDDPLVLASLKRILLHLGCTVEATQDPPTALEILYKKQVDAVILDWMLPTIPGEAMLAEITSSYREIEVAIVSGALWWDGAEDYLRNRGAKKVIHKPVPIDSITSWLQEVSAARAS